jgi:hypothetical protein
MSKRMAASSLSIGMLALFLMANMTEAVARKPGGGGGGTCGRKTVGFFNLASSIPVSGAGELNTIYNCTTAIYCRGGHPAQFEVKQIAAYGVIPQWLVDTSVPSSSFYTPAQQDAIIGNARNLAAANKPPLKFVYDIQFFWDQAAEYHVGANVKYAACGP